MHTSLPAKSFARKGQRRSWPGPGAARLSVQGSEETKTRVDEGNKPCSAEVSLVLFFPSLSTGGLAPVQQYSTRGTVTVQETKDGCTPTEFSHVRLPVCH
jgi:hypothetical protein